MSGNSVACELPSKIGRGARVALDCRNEATEGNSSIQAASPMLAFIDECFVSLKWKYEYAVVVINTHAGRAVVDAPRFSRAMRGADGKVFDIRWLDHLLRDEDFRTVHYNLSEKKFGVGRESLTELLLRSCENHLSFIRARVANTAVSE